MADLYFQQGDVLLKKCGNWDTFIIEHNGIPTDAKSIKGNILFKGANNTHFFKSGDFELLEHEGTIFVRVNSESVLSHGEHGDIKVAPYEKGYFLDIVKEYDHALEESRQVID